MTTYTLSLPVGAGRLTITADTAEQLLHAATGLDLADLATLAPAAPGKARKDTPALAHGVMPEPCPHGPRTYRDGSSPKGPWAAWFCPAPKGTPGQCDPLWVEQGKATTPHTPAPEPAPW